MLAVSAMPVSSAAAAGDEVDPGAIVLRSRIFDIPFQMGSESQATLVRLYVSKDRGKSWEIAVEKPLPITQFHFEATSDGDFWFAHATDLDAISDPATQLAPERKISVDTSGPAIDLIGSASLDGTLSATLKLTDSRQIKSLRVLFATDVVPEWKFVSNASIDAEGRFSVQPADAWRQMNVHITATDSIGNASVHSKSFRRPRIAATKGPRLAATRSDQPGGQPGGQRAESSSPNRLRVQTVAGPSDPPNFLLGPMPPTLTDSPNTPTMQTFSPRGFPLQSPGVGPVTGAPRTAAPQARAPAIANGQTFNRSFNSFGPGFRDADNRAITPNAPSTTGAAPPSPSSTGPVTESPNRTQPAPSRTLPSAGLAAMVTPSGIEVLPPPEPEPDPDASDPTSNPESLTRESLRTPAPEQVPIAAPTNTLPGDPITKPVPSTAPRSVIENRPPRSRTLSEAMRPITPTTNTPSSKAPAPTATSRSPEVIPAPKPSQTPEDTRLYRAERAELRGREEQLRYDRAQLARTVPFRYSNSNRFSLEYELEAVGASGVESVELYGSVDAGRSWKRWGADPDRTSPFDIETKGEGIFSFQIVVLGNNGLASPRPLPGDDPDIAVVVDQTIPRTRITSARYGEGDRTGSLIIRYECSDENLMSRPVAIAFGDSMDGPWTTIAAGLRNDGLYVWPADPKLPPKIYLRVDAKDQAGNTGSYLLDQPIATGGLAPRARILGFRSR